MVRMADCADCRNYININSDHAIGCPQRKGALYFRDDGTPVMEGEDTARYCVICGEEFEDKGKGTWYETLDHGHDSHGLYHFQDPTTEGRRPVDMKYPLSYEEQDDRAAAWIKAAWEQT